MNLPKGILFLMFSLFVVNLFAQNSPSNSVLEKEAMTTVYFATNKYELDLSAQAIINDFIINKEASTSFELRLRGFTDDIGNRSSNETLALNRAMEVKEYLERAGVATKNIKILDCKELTLDSNNNLAEQRRENRRVALEYWTEGKAALSSVEFEHRELNAFFVNNRKEAQQAYSFEAAESFLLRADKGTLIKIPANCFVDQRGDSAKGTITFMVQEVYSYKDMILQNLATTSNEQQLETGGMLYLEAKDAQGNILSIREGKNISATMASQNATLTGMQTFEGKGSGNGLSINWEATEDTVQRGANQRASGSTFSYYGNSYRKGNLDSLMLNFAALEVWNERMPTQSFSKPSFKLRKPRAPRLRKVYKETKETLREKYPKGKKEKKESYRKRIWSKYFALKKKDRKNHSKNKQLVKEYKKDSTKYAVGAKEYEANRMAYEENQTRMKTVLHETYLSVDHFSLDTYTKSYHAVNDFSNKVFNQEAELSFYKQELQNQLSASDTIGEDLLVQLNAISTEDLLGKNKEAMKEISASITLDRIAQKFYKRKESQRKSLESYTDELQRFWAYIKDKKQLSTYDLAKIRSKRKEIAKQYDYTALTRLHQTKEASMEKIKPVVSEFLKVENQLLAIQEAYDSLSLKYNLSKPESLYTNYETDYRANVLKVSNMGWINCDRFYKTKEPLMARMKIDVKPTNNTYFYVVFKEIKSVMPASFAKDHFGIMRVPSNAAVQIIGLRKNGENIELSLNEGILKELNGLKPVFEKKTTEEMNTILATL
jgi:outer membrane protein OmpA-like peptidoglycan-associated protein